MNYILSLIDMQDAFLEIYEENVRNNIVSSCVSLIQEAIYHNNEIIIVEFDGCGHTNERILSELSDYDNVFFLKKTTTDGSNEILDLLNKRNLFKPIRIGGLYTDRCIKDTVAGLTQFFNEEIQIVICATLPFYKNWAFNYFEYLNASGVKVKLI